MVVCDVPSILNLLFEIGDPKLATLNVLSWLRMRLQLNLHVTVMLDFADFLRPVECTIARYFLSQCHNPPDSLLIDKLPEVSLSRIDWALGRNDKITIGRLAIEASNATCIDIAHVCGIRISTEYDSRFFERMYIAVDVQVRERADHCFRHWHITQ